MRLAAIRILFVVLGAGLLGACAVSDPVEASDDGLFVTGRMQLPIDGGETHGATVEFAGSSFGGDASVQNPAGGEVDYGVREVTAAVRYELRRSRLDFAVLAGLQTDMLRLETRAGGGPWARDHEFYVGPVLGVEAGWRAGDRVRMYTRICGAAMLPSSSVLSAEAGLGFRVLDELELLAGYRRWSLRADTDTLFGTFDSIDLDVDGIFVGGELRF